MVNYAFTRNTGHRLRACAVLALAFCAAFAIPALFATAAGPAPAVEAKIAKFAYEPKEITIAPGTKVVWTNQDDVPHTVTGAEKKFSSPVLDTGQKFSYTFGAEGEYSYYCTIHPKMTGKVTVR